MPRAGRWRRGVARRAPLASALALVALSVCMQYCAWQMKIKLEENGESCTGLFPATVPVTSQSLRACNQASTRESVCCSWVLLRNYSQFEMPVDRLDLLEAGWSGYVYNP